MRADPSAQITLRTLVAARWVLLALSGIAAAIVTVAPQWVQPLYAWFPRPLESSAIAIALGSWLLANVLTERLVLRRGRATGRIAGVHLLVDATVLTLLLGFSGGPTNPFTTLYFVPITLATQVSPRWTWALAGYCLLGFASLFVLHPLPQAPAGHEAHFAGHLRGMWIAFGVSGALVTYFVHRIALSLARQREELARLSAEALRDRHLAALGTLAAGAAHELGTPLGSIHLLAGELPHMSPAERDEALATILGETARCKDILHRMASPEISVESFGAAGSEGWRLSVLAEQARGVASRGDVTLAVRIDADPELRLPRTPMEQIVRELVANAVDACRRREDGGGTITLVLGRHGDDAIVEVRDEGVGMDAEAATHAFEPFYSTKQQGLGLGLYLARAQVRQLGGDLELDTSPGQGTRLRMRLPPQATGTHSGSTPIPRRD